MGPYSIDLRERVAAAIDQRQSQRQLATRCQSIKNAKATVLRLPPYSSDYNPIEELSTKRTSRSIRLGDTHC